MKIKSSKDALITGIQIVQNIVSSKSALPILSNISIETKGSVIKLYATDLDIGISCEIPVNILEEGAITILSFLGILSINLAVINIIPFPALDDPSDQRADLLELRELQGPEAQQVGRRHHRPR